MDWDTFEELIRYILTNLFDYAALETNALIYTVIKPPAHVQKRTDYVREVITEAISHLRPARKEESPSSPEWRPYLILQKRYVEGMGLNDLSTFLSISTRQLRRDHHRALNALTILLWNQFFPEETRETVGEEPDDDNQMAYDIQKETLDPQEVLDGVYVLLKPRFEKKGIEIVLRPEEIACQVLSDRVILRQILIGLFNEFFRIESIKKVEVELSAVAHEVLIKFSGSSDASDCNQYTEIEDDLDTIYSWCAKMDARLEKVDMPREDVCSLRYRLWLPRVNQRVILVVDDQEVAINLYRRYLSQSSWTIVGTNRPEQVLPLVRQYLPEVITLDVMMPQMDGWELLQTLRSNEDTRQIPVIICSAWADPDLARSLGASDYLKKPITQKALMDSLAKLNLKG